VGVDREIWQRIAAHCVQYAAGILRDHLDVAVKQHPVAGQRFVTVTERMPAMMCRCILANRDNAGRRRIRINADIGPRVQRPRVGGTSRYPALLADYLRSQLQRQTGEGRARRAMVNTI
jgi:hypothetical protein